MKAAILLLSVLVSGLAAKGQTVSVFSSFTSPPSSAYFQFIFPHSNFTFVDSTILTNNLTPKTYECTFIFKECAPPLSPRTYDTILFIPLSYGYGETRVIAHLWLDSNTVDSNCTLRPRTWVYSRDVSVWNYTNLAVPKSVENSFSIYPNPATSSITIRPQQGKNFNSISIRDITGREVINASEPDKVNATSQTINISQLSPGTYFIKAKDENQLTVTKKFVKL